VSSNLFADAEPPRRQVRLRMKANTATRGSVDGAWWPRSTDPAAEFPGLVLAMSSWVGPVNRVAYNLDNWAETGRELNVEGWSVTLVGDHLVDANTVVVTGPNQRRMLLLVIPPGTRGGVARAVLRSAADPHTVASVGEILESNGVTPGEKTNARMELVRTRP
jgi:hypothetical protein